MKRDGVVPWPRDLAESYAAAGYWRGSSLGEWMWDWADRYGERIAVVAGDRELAEQADVLAAGLLELGLSDGDNILVQLPNSWEFLALFLACQRIGVAPVLALLPFREHELLFLANLATAKAIVVPDRAAGFDHQELAGAIAGRQNRPCPVLVVGQDVRDGNVDVRALLAAGAEPGLRQQLNAVAPDSREVALFLLSGGTTGLPKIIARTHDDYEYNLRRSGEVCGFTADTVYLVTLPMGHNFPLGCPGILGTLRVGGRVVMSPSPKPEVAFPIIERQRVTVTSLVPAIAQRWVEASASTSADLSSLRVVQVGGSVLPPDFAARIGDTLGVTLQQVYGMAEGLLNYTRLDDPVDVIVHTQGRPISDGDEILIVDDADNPVPLGGEGELLTRGPYTPRGYFAAPEHNARAFTSDGWYRSGDVVKIHPSGNFVVTGRVKDLINRGGEKISAPEVEAVVTLLPQVRAAAAIPVPDPEYGERICVCVVLRGRRRLSLDEVRDAFIRTGVAKYKIPEQVEIVTELPLTGVGKVDKKALRRLVDQRMANLPPAASG